MERFYLMCKTCLIMLVLVHSTLYAQWYGVNERKNDTLYFNPCDFIIHIMDDTIYKKNKTPLYEKKITFYSDKVFYISFNQVLENKNLAQYKKYLFDGSSVNQEKYYLEFTFYSNQPYRNLDLNPLIEFVKPYHQGKQKYPSPRFSFYLDLQERVPEWPQVFAKEIDWVDEIFIRNRDLFSREITVSLTVNLEGGVEVTELYKDFGKRGEIDSSLLMVKDQLERLKFPVFMFNHFTSVYSTVHSISMEEVMNTILYNQIQHSFSHSTPVFEAEDSIYVYNDSLTGKNFIFTPKLEYKHSYFNKPLVDCNQLPDQLLLDTCYTDLNGDGLLDLQIYKSKNNGKTTVLYVLKNSPIEKAINEFTYNKELPNGYFYLNDSSHYDAPVSQLFKFYPDGLENFAVACWDPAQIYENRFLYSKWTTDIERYQFLAFYRSQPKNKQLNFFGGSNKRGEKVYQNLLDKIEYYVQHPEELP